MVVVWERVTQTTQSRRLGPCCVETGVAGGGARLQGGRWKECGGVGGGDRGRWWLRWEEGREVVASSTKMAAEWCGGECDELACLLTAA